MRYWHGEHRDVRMLLRLSVLPGEHSNYSQIITKEHLLIEQQLSKHKGQKNFSGSI